MSRKGIYLIMNERAFEGIEVRSTEVAHRSIAMTLRERILKGLIPPGTELPPTSVLATKWNTSYFTAHTALKTLTKEGLLERKHGAGTHVRDRVPTLEKVGIYYGSTRLWTCDESAFYRNIYAALESRLHERGIEMSVFVDHRPSEAQTCALPALVKAVEQREVQAIIAPLVNQNLPQLLKLPVPVAAITSGVGVSAKVGYDNKEYFRTACSKLKARGCRTVGLISPIQVDSTSLIPSERLFYYHDFLREMEFAGLSTRTDWIRRPKGEVSDLSRFGYQEFKALWSLDEHPDAVIAYPDMTVRGVVTAALEMGLKVPKEVTFLFHRNAHVEVLCPFPALWAISDEDLFADALINMVCRQFKGESVSPMRIPITFESMTTCGVD